MRPRLSDETGAIMRANIIRELAEMEAEGAWAHRADMNRSPLARRAVGLACMA